MPDHTSVHSYLKCEYIILASKLAQFLVAILMETTESDQSWGNLLADLSNFFFWEMILYTIIRVNSILEICLIKTAMHNCFWIYADDLSNLSTAWRYRYSCVCILETYFCNG